MSDHRHGYLKAPVMGSVCCQLISDVIGAFLFLKQIFLLLFEGPVMGREECIAL